MPKDIAAMDLIGLMPELEVLEGARIDKFYQREKELVMYAYKPGDQKYRLFMAGGKAFLTDYKREMPQHPPGFCMMLRKRLGGAEITRVEQYDFDRIIEIHTDEEVLICELFNEGNFVLAGKDDTIKQAMRTGSPMGRDIYPDEEYPRPDPSTHPGDIASLDKWPEQEVVIALAAKCGLGGRYAEEVCSRAEVDKNQVIEDLPMDDRDRVLHRLHELVKQLEAGSLDPRVYSDDDGPVMATPVPFQTFQQYDSATAETFSRALDTYYTEGEKADKVRQQRKQYQEQQDKLQRRLDQQEGKLEGLTVAVEENREKGDLIYEHYSLVEDVIESVRAAREQYSSEEIEERLDSEAAQGVPAAAAIEHLDLPNQAVVVDLDGTNVRLDLTAGVEENAEQYYEKSKTSKRKIKGVKEAMQETRQQLDSLEEEDVDVDAGMENKRKKQEQKKWYEKFRWCYSSDGFLIIGGRDTTTNDMLVKKYMEDGDRYVHADFTGAPSVVIKADGEELPASTLEEAGQLAVTFAKSWQAGVTSEDAYHVAPDQVTQEPESGEYLPKGSFVIRGDRTYLKNLPVEAAVGAYEREDGHVPMGGPPAAVAAQCDHYVTLREGGEKKSDVAKQVKKHLDEQTGGSLDLDKIVRALPPGKSTVDERH